LIFHIKNVFLEQSSYILKNLEFLDSISDEERGKKEREGGREAGREGGRREGGDEGGGRGGREEEEGGRNGGEGETEEERVIDKRGVVSILTWFGI
jgi:hypothetical protein